MAYRIEGLAAEPFQPLFALDDAGLAAHRAVRVVADSPKGYPCRVSLVDAAAGEELLLVNHVSNDVEGPFRTSHAVFVRKAAAVPARYVDEVPAYLASRNLSLRAFDAAGMLLAGEVVMPGEADARIRELFGNPAIDTIHAHTAAYGCFLARIERN